MELGMLVWKNRDFIMNNNKKFFLVVYVTMKKSVSKSISADVIWQSHFHITYCLFYNNSWKLKQLRLIINFN